MGFTLQVGKMLALSLFVGLLLAQFFSALTAATVAVLVLYLLFVRIG